MAPLSDRQIHLAPHAPSHSPDAMPQVIISSPRPEFSPVQTEVVLSAAVSSYTGGRALQITSDMIPPVDIPLPAPFAARFLPRAGADTLVIAFASIGHDPARMPEPEFLRLAPGHDRAALFFSDASRSWASGPGWLDALRAALAATGRGWARVVTLGVSMGGVSALRAAEAVPVDAVLAIGPQARLEGEGRWAHWTAGRVIPPTPLPQGPWIVLAHGLVDDGPQAAGFALRRGVDHLLFPGISHSDLGPHLKARGLAGMIDALAAGDRRRLLRIAQAAGATRRQEPR